MRARPWATGKPKRKPPDATGLGPHLDAQVAWPRRHSPANESRIVVISRQLALVRFSFATLLLATAGFARADDPWIVFDGAQGAGQGQTRRAGQRRRRISLRGSAAAIGQDPGQASRLQVHGAVRHRSARRHDQSQRERQHSRPGGAATRPTCWFCSRGFATCPTTRCSTSSTTSSRAGR